MFYRREDNTVVFVCILVGKGKEYFSQYLKSFFRYTASVLKVLVFRQTTVLDKKLPFVGDIALSLSLSFCRGSRVPCRGSRVEGRG